MVRPIVSTPDKLDGKPHLEGTSITVEEVKSYWRQRGVYGAQARERFPELSENELAAAIMYDPKPAYVPEFEYVAEDAGPPRRRFFLWNDGDDWAGACEDVAEDGTATPLADWFYENYQRHLVLVHARRYASGPLKWRDCETGEAVEVGSTGLAQKKD